MNILVCVKQVPASTEVNLDPVTHTIVRDGRQALINPNDLNALEAALELREARGGRVTVLTMGISAAEAMLREALAMGADEAVLLTDRRFAGADTYATALTLSLGIKKLGAFDLILTGRMAIDGDTAQIGPELAELLGVPHIAGACAIAYASGGSITVKKAADGQMLTLRASLPALVALERGVNIPRFPTLPGALHGLGAEVVRMGLEDIGASCLETGLEGSMTHVLSTAVPERSRAAVLIGGDAAQQAAAVLELIRGAKK